MFVSDIERQFIKLRKSVETCDSDTPSVALSVGRFAEAAFCDKEINENVLVGIMQKANTLTTKFEHNCSCKMK